MPRITQTSVRAPVNFELRKIYVAADVNGHCAWLHTHNVAQSGRLRGADLTLTCDPTLPSGSRHAPRGCARSAEVCAAAASLVTPPLLCGNAVREYLSTAGALRLVGLHHSPVSLRTDKNIITTTTTLRLLVLSPAATTASPRPCHHHHTSSPTMPKVTKRQPTTQPSSATSPTETPTEE